MRRKAQAAGEILRTRLDRLGLRFEETLIELVGVDACTGPSFRGLPPDLPWATLRIGVRGKDQGVGKFTKEIAPLVLNGPPTVTGFAAAGRKWKRS
jgi:hypothetical protein